MGTGSFGSGGSGAAGRAGSGSRVFFRQAVGSRPTGGFFSWRDKPSETPSFEAARELLRYTFSHRNVATFVQGMAASDQIRGCYEELFRFSALIKERPKWASVEREYGVASRAGCLADVGEAITSRHAVRGSEAHREVARSAVLDVLLALVQDDDEIFLHGDATEVFAKLKPEVLASLSGYFLGSLLHRAALRELPTLQEEEGLMVRGAAQERADFIIDAFKRAWIEKDGDKNQVTYRDLFRVIAEKKDWFENKLREEIEP